MRFGNRALCAGGLCLAVSCLAGCGSSGSLLSASQSSELKNQLGQVSRSLNVHQCQQAANEINTFRSTVDGMSLNQTLVSNLDQGASTVAKLAAKQCPKVTQPAHTTPTTTTPTTPTPTTATQTTPPTTQPTTPSTTPAPPPPTTPTPSTTTTPAPTGPGSGGAGLGDGGGGNGHGNGTG